jgi:tetratricopeptide (TPR) repeat protein
MARNRKARSMQKSLTVLILLATLFAGAARSDPAAALGRLQDLLAEGRYGDAEALLYRALEEDAKHVGLLAAQADLFLALGRYEEAGEAAKKGGRDPRCLALLAESHLFRGQLAEAEKTVSDALAEGPDLERARFVRGQVLLEKGDRKEAIRAFAWFFDHYALNDLTAPEPLTLVAQASVELAALQPDVAMDFHVTMKLLDRITKDHPGYLPGYARKGELYLRVYQDQDAKKAFETALKLNPRYPPALLGLANQMAFRWNEMEGVEKCEEALATNPNLYEAREYIARIRIADSRYDEAREHIEKVLEVNPRRKTALALLCALDFITGNEAGFEARTKEIATIDKGFSGALTELAGALESQRRFAEAAEVAQKAVKVDPDDFMAWWIRGRNLVNLGTGTRSATTRATSFATTSSRCSRFSRSSSRPGRRTSSTGSTSARTRSSRSTITTSWSSRGTC